MIKLEHLKVSNFRNLSTVDINFRNLNVLAGPNNSGKSNFLQIINFLNVILNESIQEVKKLFISQYSPLIRMMIPHRALTTKKKNDSTEFEIRFSNKNNKTIYTYRISISWERTDGPMSYDFKIKQESLEYKLRSRRGPAISIFKRTRDNVIYGSDLSKPKTQLMKKIPSFASVTRFLEIIHEKNNPYNEAIECLNVLLNSPVYYFSNIQLMRRFKSDLSRDALNRIISFDINREILSLSDTNFDIMKKVLNDVLKIEDVRIYEFETPIMEGEKKSANQKFIFYNHFGTYKDLTDLSDGSVLLIALITKILGSSHNLFVIEEPENSLHPAALTQLITFIHSFSKENQFIIATHSLVILNSVNPNDVVISCVGEDGQSNFYNVANMRDLKKKIKEGYIDFSDYIFFEEADTSEFESL